MKFKFILYNLYNSGFIYILKGCDCDIGMEYCDSFTGTCKCLPNVVGSRCDRCEINHYGFQSGFGCQACHCSEASKTEQCDDETGQCLCMPGVTGKHCDRCLPGYWNFTSNGCERKSTFQ